MGEKKFYVTTAIDYVNAEPHVGHAYEKIATDVVARWHRLLGEDVWFLTGTDENAKKNELAAKAAGIPVKQFVDKNAALFVELCKALNLSNDDFIRTTELRHVKAAQMLFKKIYDAGDIYKDVYKGLYCVGCESFLTEKDLVNGRCPEHNKEPEFLEEESYFFRLSKYQKQIEKMLQKKGFVLPDDKRKEMLSRLKEGLKDLSVSRTNQTWGIDVPIDSKHKIYVWIDALSNYISALDWPEGVQFKKYWPADVHVIGKGIHWFHSVIWPALLISAGIELPRGIFVHGYLTVNEQKISKSLGNVVDPIYLIKKYSSDSLRYFLLREIPLNKDGDFSEESLKSRHNNELADKLGNLVSRVTALTEKYGIEKCENKLLKKLKLKEIEKHIENYELDKALSLIFDFIDACNEYVQENKLWETKDKKKLYEVADSIKAVTILLWPFVPASAEKIAAQFGFEIKFDNIETPLIITKIKKAEILFRKIQ